jgi:hypothetical protein
MCWCCAGAQALRWLAVPGCVVLMVTLVYVPWLVLVLVLCRSPSAALPGGDIHIYRLGFRV